MADLQLKRGTTLKHSTFTGKVGEATIDIDKDTLVVHDGSTVGGFPLARESQVSALSANVYTKEESNTSLALKVDKLTGKQLSTEDYTTTDKTKLDGIATNANNYVKPVNEPISYIAGLQTALDAKATTTALNTEKGRIDSILLAADANADTFAEVITLVNSIDTTNDQAFAGYVLSNDARSATIEVNVTNLTSLKADKATTYTKSETDAKIEELAPATDISGKADIGHTHIKSEVGLSNVDNTSDIDKPVSTAQAAAIVLKQDVLIGGTNIKTINGVDPTGSGNISTTQTSVSGNAGTATKLETVRSINGVSFDGSIDIIIEDATKIPLTGGTLTGALTAIRETKVAMAANNIDLATGNLFTKTISGVTTLTISNVLAADNVNSFVLELTNGGSAIITWFSGVKWAGGTAPTLTASGKDILGFYSHDGGTTWNILGVNKDVK